MEVANGWLVSKNRTVVILCFLMLFAFTARVIYSLDFPLSGDEVGVGMLQITGWGVEYSTYDGYHPIPISVYESMLEYDSNYGLSDVHDSLKLSGGMHPPLYYYIIRYFIYFFNNDLMSLRIISIIFSMVSIVFGYLLGKKLYSQPVGFLLAAIFAFSSYTTKYSIMVRPYPMLFTISLVSTYQMLKVAEDFSFKKLSFYFYILLTAIGMYTLYHYLFVIAFQFTFLMLTVFTSKSDYLKKLFLCFVMYFGAVLLFLPWLPILQYQLGVVGRGVYYFHSEGGFIGFLNTLFHLFWITSASRLPGAIPMVLRELISWLYIAISIYGIMIAAKNKRMLLFIVSSFAYLLIYFGIESSKGMNTLLSNKFLFFTFIIVNLFCSIALINIKPVLLKRIVFIMIFILLLTNLAGEFVSKHRFDGNYMKQPYFAFKEYCANKSVLMITNNRARRFIFPFVHTFKDFNDDISIYVAKAQDGVSDTFDYSKYDTIVIFNDNTEGFLMYTEADISRYEKQLGVGDPVNVTNYENECSCRIYTR